MVVRAAVATVAVEMVAVETVAVEIVGVGVVEVERVDLGGGRMMKEEMERGAGSREGIDMVRVDNMQGLSGCLTRRHATHPQ